MFTTDTLRPQRRLLGAQPALAMSGGRMAMRALILAGVLLTVACAGRAPQGEQEPLTMMAGVRCGVERWSVKTLTDPEASQVNLTPTPSTVEDLTALPVPDGFGRDAGRLPPELQTYTVAATLVEFKEEADSDIHLVIHGSSGQSMIAEIPDPQCAQGSRVLSQISGARAQFVAKFGQPSLTSWTRVNAPITVEGVLFFDVPHGQTGVATNAIELHPVLEIAP